MHRLRPLLIVGAVLAALVTLPSQALAISPVTTDCNANNKLTHHYSVSQLRNALATMPADVKEYTSCYQVIDDQLFRQLGKPLPSATAGSTGGGSSFISTPVLIVVILVIVLGAGLAYAAARRGGGGSPPSAPTG